MNTFRLTVKGLVQGVGFRPFIYRLATQFGLNGFVRNDLHGVTIDFNAERQISEQFLAAVLNQKPTQAEIKEFNLELIETSFFDIFEIKESSDSGLSDLVIPPDFSVCSHCTSEMYDQGNRRFEYPFITCTDCGPRYSLLTHLPFDRENTSMAPFKMCVTCQKEYFEPNHRRFYSQTNSCWDCGISMQIFDNQQNKLEIDPKYVVNKIVELLQSSYILAIKSIAGYVLMCDATNENVVKELRFRKKRPSKPFAVIYNDIEQIKESAEISAKEAKILESDMAPIVIVKQREKSYIAPSVNPNLDALGCFLAYSPLLKLICKKFGKPLIATSGNISGSPIIYKNDAAIEHLSKIADFVITNNREIEIPQDDSVLKVSNKCQKVVVIRRGRGMKLDVKSNSKRNSLAMGASMKSTFALDVGKMAYVSQYLGDLDSYDSQLNYSNLQSEFLDLFIDRNLENIFVDAHPAYFSSKLGSEFAHDKKIALHQIQHHKAHLVAVLSDNELMESRERFLGVIWDGTGFGDDGHIWGGEFFEFHKKEITRINHLTYFPMILGDKMAKQPRISALCLALNNKVAEKLISDKFSELEYKNYVSLAKNSKLKCSSIGRLFDAVASILGLMDFQTFEGQAATLLEQHARSYFDEVNYKFSDLYSDILCFEIITNGIINDLILKKEINFIAAKFHYTLVHCIEEMANKNNFKNIVFSGGTFQNTLLIDLCIAVLSKNFKIYFHKDLSPNDESISYGQINYPLKNNNYVFSNTGKNQID